MTAIEPEVVDAPDKRLAKRNGKQAEALTNRPQVTVEDLMLKAIEVGNIELLDKLYGMFEKREAERREAAFNLALSTFERNCPVIPRKRPGAKNKANADFNPGGVRYHFSALEDVDIIVKPRLGEQGLSYTVKTALNKSDPKAPLLVATCIVRHSEGHREATDFEIPVDLTAYMTEPQKYASAASFAERYAIKHALGLTFAGEDNDAAGKITPAEARAARGPVSQPKPTPTAAKRSQQKSDGERTTLQPAPEGEAIEASTIKVLTSKMEHAALGNGDFKKRFGLNGVEQINRKDINTVLAWIIDPQNA